MAESRVITSYLEALSGRLPAEIVDELADGLAETHRAYLRRGLDPDPAAEAATAEFGEPDVVVDCFTASNPARIAARRLLSIGPAVGTCWAAALMTSRAWGWPVVAVAPVLVLLGLTVIVTIGLLAAAALSRAYLLARRAGLAACAATTAIDVAVITGVIATAPAITWLTAAAIAASSARIVVAAPTLRLARAR